jgi:hypothetical protein
MRDKRDVTLTGKEMSTEQCSALRVSQERHHVRKDSPVRFTQSATSPARMRNFSHWHLITKGLEPFGPGERNRLFQRQAEDDAKDRAWVQRHRPLSERAVVLPFTAVWEW